MTLQLCFRTSHLGRRYALYRVKGYGSLVWRGISVSIADQALREGSIPTGRMRGALVELVEGK